MNRKQMKLIAIFLFIICVSVNCDAQNADISNLRDVLSGNLIETRGFSSINWMKDGESYSRIERNAETGGMEFVMYKAKDNARQVLIPSSMLIDPATGKNVSIREDRKSTRLNSSH